MIGYDRNKMKSRGRDLSMHQPGTIPHSSHLISPITSNRHKYELKQPIHSKKAVESWFETHSPSERRAVYSFLESLRQSDSSSNRRKSFSRGENLDEIVQSLEKYRPSTSMEGKERRFPSINKKKEEKNNDEKEIDQGRRYLSSTWRVTNPGEELLPIHRTENNRSSFFNYTKKTVPEYYFIHPQWY